MGTVGDSAMVVVSAVVAVACGGVSVGDNDVPVGDGTGVATAAAVRLGGTLVVVAEGGSGMGVRVGSEVSSQTPELTFRGVCVLAAENMSAGGRQAVRRRKGRRYLNIIRIDEFLRLEYPSVA